MGIRGVIPVSSSDPGAERLPSDDSFSATRTVIDSAGRRVTIPAQVNRIATIGAVPQLNTYLFTLGESDKIVNGLSFARTPRFKYQTVFAPGLAWNPDVSGSHNIVNLDVIREIKPDVALVKLTSTAEMVEEQTGIPTLVLPPRTPGAIKHGVLVLAEILNKQERAARYIQYFGDVIRRVRHVSVAIPTAARPTVLYLHLAPLERRGLIMEWAIWEAGGRSVLGDSTTVPHPFTINDLLRWDPDVLICMEPEDRVQLTADPSFQSLKAVRNGRIYVAPTGGHSWGNGCTEQPLGLIWTALQLHPDQFRHFDLVAEARYFYQTFYDTLLTDEQIQEILSGER